MLKFKTNVQTSPPFGRDSTSSFVLEKEGHKIVGFHGKSSHELHQFGVYVTRIFGFNELNMENWYLEKSKMFSERHTRMSLLERLKVSLLAGTKMLAGTDQKAYDDQEVRRWLNEFHDASFKAEIILKDLSESMGCFENVYFPNLREKLKRLTAQLEHLVFQIKLLGLRDCGRSEEVQWLSKYISSLIYDKDYLQRYLMGHGKISEPSSSKKEELHGEPERSSQNYEDIALASKTFQKQNSNNLTTLSNDAGSSSQEMIPLENLNDTDFESFKVTKVLELKTLSASMKRLHIEGCPELEFLPESLFHDCHKLQELLLVDCHSLVAFRGGYPSTALKTLYIRDCMKLEFIESLQTMLGCPQLEDLFIGSSCSTLSSFPLAFLPNLKSLSIRDCEEFSSFMFTSAHGLEVLEITNFPKLESFPDRGLQTLQLTSLLISNCRNLKGLPAKLSTLTSLLPIHINDCPEVEGIPYGGFPESLRTLCIGRCQKLRLTARQRLSSLGNLRDLEIEGGNDDIESFLDKNILPRNLYSLRISEFKNLQTLNHIEALSALGILEISRCEKLASLPYDGLPSSLSLLRINGCPILKEKIYKRDIEWFKIKHIELVEIDGEELLRGRRKKTEYLY